MEPEKINIKKVGQNLDFAVSLGLLQKPHLQKAEERKLKTLGANQSSIKTILSDIYMEHSQAQSSNLVLLMQMMCWTLIPNWLAWRWCGILSSQDSMHRLQKLEQTSSSQI